MTTIILPDNSDIKYFETNNTTRSENDTHNKIREKIVEYIKYIDDEYFEDPEYGASWKQFKTSFEEKMLEICPSYFSYDIQSKAGRHFNYDFNINFFDAKKIHIKTIKLEFKFNATSIHETPQFVSPMKPSQYLSQSFEEYYYHHYLIPLLHKFKLTTPDLETYLKQVHGNKPKCMENAQQLYYQGCKKSSKYTGTEKAIHFYEECNDVSSKCIQKYISETDLNIEKLNQYLIQSQEDKIYLLYKDHAFHLQYSNSQDYTIQSYEKETNKYRYIATTLSNKKIKILLRWKNGNGIAYPAFQIS